MDIAQILRIYCIGIAWILHGHCIDVALCLSGYGDGLEIRWGGGSPPPPSVSNLEIATPLQYCAGHGAVCNYICDDLSYSRPFSWELTYSHRFVPAPCSALPILVHSPYYMRAFHPHAVSPISCSGLLSPPIPVNSCERSHSHPFQFPGTLSFSPVRSGPLRSHPSLLLLMLI